MPTISATTRGAIDADTTRRRFLHMIGAAGLLAGCASSEDRTAAPSATPTATGGFPRRVSHKYGETVIDASPRRVVSIGFTDHDALLALGVVPVGIGGDESSALQRFGVFPWAQQELGAATPQILNYSELNIEAVAALSPDLITGMTAGMTEQEYRLLSAIAPTVAQLSGFPDYFAPWQDVTRATGRMLGRPEEAEALVAGVEAHFAAARLAHPEFAGRSLAYGGVFDGGFYTENSRSPRVKLITALGFVVPADIDALAADGGSYSELSVEQLELLDRDVLVWETPLASQRASVRDNAVYRGLAVAREGRDVFVDDELLAAAMGYVSVLSVPTVVDLLVPRLAAALTGRPTPTAS